MIVKLQCIKVLVIKEYKTLNILAFQDWLSICDSSQVKKIQYALSRKKNSLTATYDKEGVELQGV